MKFALAYYLLIIYSTVILKSLIPIAEDALFHCFAEAYHVATVHAKYGNNHVEAALANDAKDDTNKNQTSSKSAETLVHIATAAFLIFVSIKIITTKVFYRKNNKLSLIFIHKNIPPPKFLL